MTSNTICKVKQLLNLSSGDFLKSSRRFGASTLSKWLSNVIEQKDSVFREMPVEVSGDVAAKITDITLQNLIPVKGYDFCHGVDYQKIVESMRTTGFQATHFGAATDEVNRMISKRFEPLTKEDMQTVATLSPCGRPLRNCTIFLGYSSSIITCGLREAICFLAKHNLIDCIVTTAGGVEEDFIKCMGDFYVGSFGAKGELLFHNRINRGGNVFVPESHYYRFTNFMQPILEGMLEEQENDGFNWTPSKMIARIGREIDDESSVYYWAYKNNIPVFCPAITDGAIGDEIFYMHERDPGKRLRIDIAEDTNHITSYAVQSPNTGMITIGAGLAKHQICGANSHRDPEGADYAVYINTAQEFDGSDSGAQPDEAVSWGKIKHTARPVKVFGEATLVFPLLVAETFAKLIYPTKN